MRGLGRLIIVVGIGIILGVGNDVEASPFHALSNIATADEELTPLSDEQLASVEGEGLFICINCVVLTQINTTLQIATGNDARLVSNQFNTALVSQVLNAAFGNTPRNFGERGNGPFSHRQGGNFGFLADLMAALLNQQGDGFGAVGGAGAP